MGDMRYAQLSSKNSQTTEGYLVWAELVNVKANWVLWTTSLLHNGLVYIATRASPSSVHLQNPLVKFNAARCATEQLNTEECNDG